ncbi:MAG TPA: TetR/AcrR family transcriptional regulator [Acidimicrobiales bacterium]|nr:TetR/AcrR family transcriptional regulator [Acidimicrobiales bacterium]
MARTGDRILDEALHQFGTRGYEATSLDAIAAALGVRKQTVLYWYPSKQALLDAVVAQGAEELHNTLDAALTRAGPGLERLDAVMRAVFRFAVRRPELLGLVREVGRLGDDMAIDLRARLQPLLDRAVAFLEAEIDAGTIRRADPRLLLLFTYSAVLGVATEGEARRALGLESSVAALARLRRELFAFLRAALT